MSTLVRLLSVAALFFLWPPIAGAQSQNQTPAIAVGDALVTGFSGTTDRAWAGGKTATDRIFIDPDGASARVVGLARAGGHGDGRLSRAPKTFYVRARDVGQVFGAALDDASAPNVYLGATSAFGLSLVARGRDGQFERRKTGGPGVVWMRGQFGLDLQGDPGSIYRVDGRTGAVSLFARAMLAGVPNPGPGLGALAYDSGHRQLFASDLYTGMVHRFAIADGAERGAPYDHGVTGRSAARLAPIPFDPSRRPNIASKNFKAEDPATWGFAPPERRVWALAVHDGRLYYSVRNGAAHDGPQIWSVGLTKEGSFDSDPRWELDVPGTPGPYSLSDIAFDANGAMIVAQRAAIAASYDYSAFTKRGEPRVLRFRLKDRADPSSPGAWKPQPDEYPVGAGAHRNSDGGVALGYGFDRNGALDTAACDASLLATGDRLLIDATPDGRIKSQVDGVQIADVATLRDSTAPRPPAGYVVDYYDRPDAAKVSGHIGVVRVRSAPCARQGRPALAAGGAAAPPGFVGGSGGGGGGGGGDGGCTGPNCCEGRRCDTLIVVKRVVNKTKADLTGWTYPVVASCSGMANQNLTLHVPDQIPVQTIDDIPQGATCSVTEPPPPIPPNACPGDAVPGGTPVWTTSISGPVFFGPSPQTITVTNTLTCDGEIIVKKVVVNRTEGDVSGYTFPVKATCTPSPTSVVNLQNGGAQTINNLPIGTMCNAADDPSALPLPKDACFNHTHPAWTATPSNTVTVSGAPQTATVTNTLTCAPDKDTGSITLIKKVSNRTDANLTGTTYPVQLNCTGNASQTATLTYNTPLTVNNIALPSTCSVQENVAPPTPPNACPKGWAPEWVMPPTYMPASAPAGTPPPTLTLLNTLICKQDKKVVLRVTKQVEDDGPLPIPASTTYPISVDCGGTVTNFSLHDGETQSVNNITPSTGCTINEPLPTFNACPRDMTPQWTTTYAPSSSVTVPQTSAVIVKNTLACVKGKPHTLDVTKKVQDNGPLPIPASTTYQISVDCGGTHTALTLHDGETQSASTGSATSCTVSETPPTANACPPRMTPQWTTSYAPSASVPVPPTSLVTVINAMTCVPAKQCPPPLVLDAKGACSCPPPSTPGAVPNQCFCPNGQPLPPSGICEGPPPPICNPPMVPNATGGCDCPPGTVLRGKECVRIKACRPPLVRTADGGCGCREGLIRRGRRCVKPIVCAPPMIPNASRTSCVCEKGYLRRGQKCVERRPTPVCRQPARLRGGVCRCPRYMKKSGDSCVMREKPRRPRHEERRYERRHDDDEFEPGDIIRELPRFFPRGGGGRDGFGPRDGGGRKGF